ncbi:peptide ABC transporter substrate-binding protein [Ectobacillus sp. JY-23]|uniref:peptide ABC transporter substrate-binding protein n=1 Tax=Ectobacillus sp. JY-23 TaxID=2933872 RepID=UPI001FF58C64|nr:peptide ABC transporter substrate-binding protein [Ectobacillus sp. JY-23]UOY92934.1 peptide ABC transporter substrate-binding protein [Ectobacillus sp. JY-23]
MKKKALIALSSVLSLSMIVGCGGNKDEGKESTGEKRPQVLNLIETDEIPTMDTTKATDAIAFRIMVNTMEGLYRLDKENKPIPGMAESYTVSDDKKTYTFKLRDAKWSNGDPVTAQDFVYAWRRLVDPKVGAEYAYIMYYIKNAQQVNEGKAGLDTLGVKATDDKTLVVELESALPETTLLALTTFPSYFPLNEKFINAQSGKFGLEAANTLYNGPFQLSEWKHNESFQFKKNDSYWDAKTVKLNTINFNIVKDVSTAVNLYEGGQVDQVGLSSEFVDKYKNSPDFKTEPEATIFYLRMNFNNPVLKNVNARKAIDLAIDKKALTTVILNNGSKPAYFFVPKDFVSNPAGKDFRELNGDFNKTDTKKAKELWAKAKEETGQQQVTLELLNFDTETSKKVGEYLKEQMEKNLEGLTVTIKQQPFKQKLELVSKKEFEMSIDGWGADYLDAVSYLDIFVSSSPNNSSSYSNPKYDKLISDVKSSLATDEEARFKALLDAEKILFEDAALAPIYQRGRAIITKPYVKDVYYHQIGGDYSYKWAYVK